MSRVFIIKQKAFLFKKSFFDIWKKQANCNRIISMFYTYVLKSSKNRNLYTGYTNDLKRRIKEHNGGVSNYTRNRGPYDLIYYEACINEFDARAREIYLKSGRGKLFLKLRLKRYFEGMDPVQK